MPAHRLARRGVLLLVAPVLVAAGVAAMRSDAAAPHGAASATSAPTGCAYRSRTTDVRHGPTGRRRVALTFDDGPSTYTPAILDTLQREGVPATFFVVGRNVAGHEDLLRRMLAGGQVIGNHSFTHRDLSRATPAALAEVDRTQAAIAKATGFTPCLVRPPYGFTSRKLRRALARRHLTSVLWSVNPRDFRMPGTALIVERTLAAVRPGSIIVAHDGGGDRSQTVAALPAIISALKAQGYRFVTVTQLLGLRLRR